MKDPRLPLRVALLSFAVLVPFALTVKAQTPSERSNRKTVIVEMFTSEGCSTCPPADALLQKLAGQQPAADADIVPLEEHVDVWDHEGWRDPYSSPEWTRRQLAYDLLFKKEGYTPQMVVNGESELLGSNEKEALSAISQAAHLVQTGVTIIPVKPEGKVPQRCTVSVDRLSGNTAGDVAEVWLAVTEDGLSSSVNRGENAGHVLHHTATLRSLHMIGTAKANGGPISFTGNPEVKIESTWNRENVHIVVFVQENKSRKILGAASTRIS